MIRKGDVISGRYTVIKQIGKGGFCTTFEVQDKHASEVGSSDPVKVMKVLEPSKFSDKNTINKAIELLQRESEVLKRLDHSGIPKVQADGYSTCKCPHTEQWLYYLVMEKIDGEDLNKWLTRNPPILETEALNWLEQIVKILDNIHPELLHRDIKPPNIMLRRNGKLVLIDFGAVKELTKTYENKTKILSPGFTPKEQINRDPKIQSDFFALGRTFVNLLTGKHPTDLNEDPQTGMLIWREDAPLISDDLVDLIDWLMEPNWRNRPKNTRDILRRIERIKAAKRGGSYSSWFSVSSIASVVLNFVLLTLLFQKVELSPGLIWLFFVILVVIAISILFPVLYRQLLKLFN